ncbi:MAG: right-handed parallel beta-helix repeat-containing protein, partial [Armatimonadota bacterium]|nr:right-handed parallel beta-helix repeat-containing protein [Armatimonadota bacterium]
MLDTGSAVIEANTFDSNEGTDHAGGIAMHDANDGSTWALSKRTIQAAVDAASEVGGDVWVKQGDYQNSSGQFLWLRPFATLYGGFYGNEVSRSQRNPATYVSAVKGNNNYASFLYSGSHLVIDGCALTQGTRGMVCSGAQPLIRGVVFTGNGPGPEGAGMFCGNRSAPVIEKCRFIGNVTTSHGGGVAFHDCNSKIVNCVFAGNTARNFDEPSAISGGGAIRTKGGTCSIINNTFVGNRSWWSAQGSPGLGGGAIFSTSTS